MLENFGKKIVIHRLTIRHVIKLEHLQIALVSHDPRLSSRI